MSDVKPKGRFYSLLSVVASAVLLAGCSAPPQASTVEPEAGASSSEEPQPEQTRSTMTDENDPIFKAQAVLGNGYSYDEVKEATDQALTAGGLPIDDSNREAIWSSVLKVSSGLRDQGLPQPDGLEVMRCAPESMLSRGVQLTDAVAYCSLEIAGIPESQW